MTTINVPPPAARPTMHATMAALVDALAHQADRELALIGPIHEDVYGELGLYVAVNDSGCGRVVWVAFGHLDDIDRRQMTARAFRRAVLRRARRALHAALSSRFDDVQQFQSDRDLATAALDHWPSVGTYAFAGDGNRDEGFNFPTNKGAAQ